MKKILIFLGLLVGLVANGQVYRIGGLDAYTKTQLQTSGQAGY